MVFIPIVISPPMRSHLISCLLLFLLAGSASAQVWVITDSRMETVQPLRMVQAMAIAAGVLWQGGASLQQRLREAYQSITDAWSLGITTLPAVVVEQRYVVYGETDLDKALARIAKYRKENPQ